MNSNREYIRKYLKKNKRQKHNKDRNTLIIGQNNKLFILYFNLVNFNIYIYIAIILREQLIIFII